MPGNRSQGQLPVAGYDRGRPTPRIAEDPLIRLTNPTQHYAWGSLTAIPDLLGLPVTSEPVAESMGFNV
jgi:hypothetical protein